MTMIDRTSSDKSAGRRRMPLASTIAFLAVAAVTCLAWYVSDTRCAFGFGGFQCAGLPSSAGGLLFGWTVLSLLLLPLTLGIAIWRWLSWFWAYRKN
ncbi:hypothetical protein [Mesorhizobium sp. CAU 1732]|uniref:hypothetical protein n=1 Tax=Mesorhizobium sp. CAU 1732 TaxID=3140358 RepID=UPI003260437B